MLDDALNAVQVTVCYHEDFAKPCHDRAELILDESLEEDLVRTGRRAGLAGDATSVACLKAFADRMLVLESERSLRQGAGAGVIDAD
jgi:hypothetical protein|tara:strand:- start:75 stop:335 length:261 start_codon:yes stop_codon:yes gene_type:complete